MGLDPTLTNPEAYRVLFENDRVRVLEYSDDPGHKTQLHQHPDSVMYTLTSFRRRLSGNDREVDVEIPAGIVRPTARRVVPTVVIGGTSWAHDDLPAPRAI